ncbi:MAG: transketolase C-terminal domain-containing protein [Candidatus Woesearchaeota archaeon]|jgi:transketolase|nr:transketolase C-terminal domain-containing protein [Candidatus Woesearchaeota archaeon]
MHLIKDLSKAENVPTRDGMGKGLVELGKTNKNVVALCCDLTDSTRIGWFKEKFPKRYVQVGVQEQNMMGIGAGMALEGKIPFVSSYAVFSPGRNWDQLRVSVCYGDANVKIIGAHAGISVGPDGATHQALEDIAITRVLPNLTVLVPADSSQAFKATLASVDISGPVYLRIGRDKFPNFTTDKTPFTVGKADIYRDGKDVAIVACGVMVYEALLAAEELEKKGISAMVVNNHTIKPIDEKTLVEVAKKTGAIVTAEEHQVQGGMGSAVAEAVANGCPVPMEFVGVQNTFGESGGAVELMEKYGLQAVDIIAAVEKVLKRK